jgi:HAD superfamily hydrolase (TIGR01484 family)
MLPLREWPEPARRGIVGVLTDIDDTLTTEGAITPDALAALAALQRAGVHVIAITGRPVGWSEPFALAWPLAGIVAENGAVALARDESTGTLRRLYVQDADLRAANRARLQAVAARILQEVPAARLARDSAGRETDIAIDHSEFEHLAPADIDRVVAIMRAHGMNATVSSIHINGWYGGHDKLTGARWSVRELLARELDSELDRWAYVGDSTNDQVMFAHFAHSIGVANLRRFEQQLVTKPMYVTQGERGAGFAQVAQAILEVAAAR